MSWRPLSQEQNLNFSTEHWWLYPKCLSRKRMKSSHVKLGSFFAKKVGLQFCSSLSLFMNERNCPNSRSAFCRKFSAEKMFRRTSVTRLGDFWKFLSTNLLTKFAYLDNFWKHLGNIVTPTSGNTACSCGRLLWCKKLKISYLIRNATDCCSLIRIKVV